MHFLAAVLDHPRFRKGDISTNFIAEEWPNGYGGTELPDDRRDAMLAVAALLHIRNELRARHHGGKLGLPDWVPDADWIAFLNKAEYPLKVADGGDGIDVKIGKGKALKVRSAWKPGEPFFRGTVNGQPVVARVAQRADGVRIVHGGAELDIAVRTPRAAELARLMPEKLPPDMSKYLLCPMPGLVVSINVAEGEPVKAGQPLAVVEAMKMENVLRAERDGTVKKVNAKKGDSLAVDQVILEFS